jgi:hypothetical protein
MSALLLSLEPVQYDAGTIIIDENDAVEQVTFLRGLKTDSKLPTFSDDQIQNNEIPKKYVGNFRWNYNVGYSVNGKKKFPVQFNPWKPIGDYEVTFNKKSAFIYQTTTTCVT